ncbi:MAG TPA: hydroxyectoine utilization dehydratase EutB [Amaricoccus sp.]|nr:hydroxyectoine utilization dehydratase EutB [Amaricoccus sp.]
MTPTLADILAARRTIAGTAVRTPLVPSALHPDLLLKLELAQPTGAFKLRGALNAIAHLPADTPGVTCCSTGNHGRAVAFAARARALRAVVCMSTLVPEAKLAAIRALGAETRIAGRSQDEAGLESRRLAEIEGLAEIPPFDSPQVIAGQGTIGLELIEDRPDLAAVLVPLSGGGLAAGIALAVKAASPATKVIGVSMDRGAAMHAALAAGRPVPIEEVPSLADSLGGGLGDPNTFTFALCRALLDDVLLVTEAEIYRAMQTHYWQDRLVTEGAAATPLAAILAGRFSPEGPTALILTGRNTDMAQFTRVVTGQPVTLGTLTLEGAPHAA